MTARAEIEYQLDHCPLPPEHRTSRIEAVFHSADDDSLDEDARQALVEYLAAIHTARCALKEFKRIR